MSVSYVSLFVWSFLSASSGRCGLRTASTIFCVFDENPFGNRSLSPRTSDYMASEDGLRTVPARCAAPVTSAESEVLAIFGNKDLADFDTVGISPTVHTVTPSWRSADALTLSLWLLTLAFRTRSSTPPAPKAERLKYICIGIAVTPRPCRSRWRSPWLPPRHVQTAGC